MTKIISLFNHKGGVSKTTTTFNLGWMLAEKGKRVIIVDADPQCNLTGMVLGFNKAELEKFYTERNGANIYSGLEPAFKSIPKMIEGIDCVPVANRGNLFLLPGHIRFSEYDTTLSIAQELSGSIQTLCNLPGSIYFLLQKTGEKHNADYMLIDMSPSVSSINQNLLMTSDFFIVPTSPDYFSTMAIESLSTIIANWQKWAEKASNLQILKNAAYPFPSPKLKFLGCIIQKYRIMSGEPAKAFQDWIDKILSVITLSLVPSLNHSGLLLATEKYHKAGITKDFELAKIPDFNTLIAKSQEHKTPIFALTQAQLKQSGVVLQQQKNKQEDFKKIFIELAEKVIDLTK
jgi:cellulose biosynthesis protein BcsQ